MKTRLSLNWFFALAVFVTGCLAASAQTVGIKFATEDEIKQDLKLAPCNNSERLEEVKKFFQKMGAAESEISAEKTKKVQNVIVTKKGKTSEIVIIGAHYDKVSDGCGAIDNWTGIVIIGNLYRTLRNAETEKTYVFIAFDKEEGGLHGSKAMAKSIPKESRPSYCSMVNVDSFGLSYPQVLENASSPKMTTAAKDLAAELKMPFSSASLSGLADSDSSSFKDKDIPAITFHGLSSSFQKYIHSSNDKVENINSSSVRLGYNFLFQYIKKIDSADCGVFRKK